MVVWILLASAVLPASKLLCLFFFNWYIKALAKSLFLIASKIAYPIPQATENPPPVVAAIRLWTVYTFAARPVCVAWTVAGVGTPFPKSGTATAVPAAEADAAMMISHIEVLQGLSPDLYYLLSIFHIIDWNRSNLRQLLQLLQDHSCNIGIISHWLQL